VATGCGTLAPCSGIPRAAAQIWRDGYRYQKAGIMLNDFCSRPGQIDMFDETPPRANSEQLMKVVDRINSTATVLSVKFLE